MRRFLKWEGGGKKGNSFPRERERERSPAAVKCGVKMAAAHIFYYCLHLLFCLFFFERRKRFFGVEKWAQKEGQRSFFFSSSSVFMHLQEKRENSLKV